MITYLEAIFIGHSDHEYHRRQKYCLEVRQHWFGRISIRPTHGFHYQPLEDMRRNYRNLKSFLRHWKMVKVIEPLSGQNRGEPLV